MDHTVHIATVSDIPAMMAVINAAFAIETFLEGTRTDEARLAEMMRKGTFLLACDPAGGVLASVYVELRGNRGYFGMLGVRPAEQGKGLGRVMVEAGEDYCRQQGCAAIDITVLSLRPELPAFYARLGYAEAGAEEFRPSRPLKAGVECHCIVMSKTL
ncbi:MAG TPA: GNAT family N-acetyltransferase [Terriglobales bacterium]|nr:GNAT family N-acetyltransferase [Terriglobales bacterium]